MSRRIGEDFKAFSDFLQNYNLSSFNSTQKQTDEYRAMHKKLFGLLIFSAEYKTQNIQKGNELFFTEMSSDLLISLFCAAQGLYKPAKLQLRCSIENFLKAMIIFDTPTIVQEKRVYAIFDAAKSDRHFLSTLGQRIIADLENDYATLCRTVHGDPNAMHPTSALELLPQYDESLLIEVSNLYSRTIGHYLEILYLNYPGVIDSMHPENKKDVLDCMAKSAKSEINKYLFG